MHPQIYQVLIFRILFVQQLLKNIHNFPPLSIQATRKLIRKHYFFASYEFFYQKFCSISLKLSTFENPKHTKFSMETFTLADVRFVHINIDFISSVPPSANYIYYVTIIDRFTRLPEFFPSTDITAETTCKALILHWASRFGSSGTVTTDQGRNFESHLF